jgi:hypothetical protein
MKHLAKWLGSVLAVALLASAAAAADRVATGKVKSVDADKKTFVLTDSANKDFTFKLGDKLIVNRDGKESKGDLKAGDSICIHYDKGVLNWTAEYILVHDGKTKDMELVHGTVKNYDATKKELTITDADSKTAMTYPMTKAEVRINMEAGTPQGLKIGDHALIIVNRTDKSDVQRVMVDRK